jgi:hypothetical protein
LLFDEFKLLICCCDTEPFIGMGWDLELGRC